MQDFTQRKLLFGSYDFSNSGYVLIFQSFLFPLALSTDGAVSSSSGTLWPWMVAASSILAIVSSPLVGAYGDRRGRGGVFAALVVFTGLLATVASAFSGASGYWIVGAFILFNCAFELSQTVYDSFLKDLAGGIRETTDLSTFGWAFGYLGGILVAVLYFVFDQLGIETPLMLAVFAVLYVALSVPAMVGLSRREVRSPCPVMTEEPRLRPPVSWPHLAVYWIVADCVAAVLYFAALYANQELGVEQRVIGAMLLGAQLLALPFTILAGKLANRVGHVRVIRISLCIWAVSLGGLYLARSVLQLAVVMVLVSVVIGSTQAILRAHYAMQVDPRAAGMGFGFYAVAQKSASVLSPAIVAVVMLATGSARPAFLVLLALIVAAAVLTGRLPSLGEGTLAKPGKP